MREFIRCRHCHGSGKVMISRRHAPKFRALRIEWLHTNFGRWQGWQGNNDPRAKRIIIDMQAVSLYAPSTYWKDVNLTSLINEIL